MPSDTLVIWHIGGTEGYGPIESILNSPFRDKVQLVVFEARENTNDDRYIEHLSINGIKAILVNSCVSDRVGQAEFYINKHPLSSSLLKPAERAKSEHIPGDDCMTWGDNTELDRVALLPTTSIDDLVKGRNLPPPDVLSIDAQGAELDVLRGGGETIRSSTLCVVSEVEFIEIYAGQGLFQDQYRLLYDIGFRLADILNQQFWHPAPCLGEGFLSVGEALFIRDPGRSDFLDKHDDKENVSRLIKLAAISFCFERYSNVYRIIEFMNERYGKSLGEIFGRMKGYENLFEIHSFVKNNGAKYAADKTYLQKELRRLARVKAISSGSLSQKKETLKWLARQTIPPFALDIARKFRRRP